MNKVRIILLAIFVMISFSVGCGGGTTNPDGGETLTYTVTFNANSADSGIAPVDGTNYEQGEPVTVPGNTGSLFRAGYAFSGWNTNSSGTGTNYNGGDQFSMGSANVTLWANWITASTTKAITAYFFSS